MEEERILDTQLPTSVPSSSLFPVINRAGLQSSASKEPPRWLSNPSFSESLLPTPSPIPEWYVNEFQGQKQREEDPLVGIEGRPEEIHTAHLLSSSDQETEEDDEKGRVTKGRVTDISEKRERKRKRKKEKEREEERKKDKKKKKEKGQKADDRQVGALEGMPVKRKSDVRRWVDTTTKAPKDYYFDTHGDRDNLAFGSLYRMDVARFDRHQTKSGAREDHRGLHMNVVNIMHLEEDDAILDDKVRAAGRYWSAKYTSLERRKNFKRLRITLRPSKLKGNKVSLIPSSDFISIDDVEIHQKQEDGKQILEEESWDDYVIRKTREFNKLTRERPHDESLWIAFASFQDELIQAGSRKAVIQQAMEKKIAVLEKALEIHPFSEDLLLMFLETCRKRDDTPTLISKWENVIMRNSGSYKLWSEFLHFRRGEFSLFSVSSLRKLYIHALQALSATRYRYHREAEAGRKAGSVKGNDAEAEKNLVSIFVDLCRFEWQTGHHELAIGLFQALVEYSLLSPSIKVNESSKQRLFQEFWDSGAPRIGEEGAAGWAAWLQKEEEQIQKAVARKMVDDDDDGEKEAGGWTGWSEPFAKDGKAENEQHSLTDDNLDVDEDKADTDMEELNEDEDEAVLLERLGLSLDSGQEVEVKDTSTWKRWSEEEYRRDCEQWLPIHTKNSKTADDDEQLPAAEDEDEQLERAILYEDIRECLFSLDTAEARFELICQFIDFCDGPFTQWCCSNSMSWKERMEALENLFGTLLEELQNASLVLGGLQTNATLEKLVGGRDWMHESEGRSSFLRNVLLLSRPLFPQSFWFQEKLLTVEGHKNADCGTANSRVAASRALAKRLLKTDRHAILLWGAYARIEAAAGNMEVARKVFDTTLTSLSVLPQETKVYAPILYLAYADAELSQPCDVSNTTMVPSHQKALHILSCLGCGRSYTPLAVDSMLSSMQLLKARRGFKDQLQGSRKECLHGDLSEESTALIACAALFELLVDGWEAAGSVFEESLAMSLPGRRQRSLQFELLNVRYIAMLEQHKQSLKPKSLRRAISQGLAQYPKNPQLLSAFIRCHSRSVCTNDLRRFFDDISLRNPSTVLWLFALSCELRRLGSGPRIRSLFERALENRETQQSVVLWRFYLAYELQVTCNPDAARRVFFRAVHACPWSKALWLDGFQKMSSILSAKELSEFQEIMREKELQLRTDVYEILLEDEEAEGLP